MTTTTAMMTASASGADYREGPIFVGASLLAMQTKGTDTEDVFEVMLRCSLNVDVMSDF
jgi:hypothetical protein